MDRMYRRQLIGTLGGLIGSLFLVTYGFAAKKAYHTYRRPEIDMPVSLAVGTVRTPEFPVKSADYLIMVQAERRQPFEDMLCKMGLTTGPLSSYNCDKEPLLQVDWIVRDDGRAVAKGSTHGRNGDFDSGNHYLFKHIGRFVGETGKKYVLEVTFTADGTSLNGTDPHLIVMLVKPSDN